MMNDLITAYENRFGLAEKVFLRTLGGNPDALLREIEEAHTQDQPDVGSSFFGLLPNAAPEEDLHNAILRDIQTHYFAPISREAALAVANTLGELGEISICKTIPELTYNAVAFVDAWNAAHPDKEPIRFNAAAYFAI